MAPTLSDPDADHPSYLEGWSRPLGWRRSLEVELNGSTIGGTGLFFVGDAEGDDDPFSLEGAPGTVTVDCG